MPDPARNPLATTTKPRLTVVIVNYNGWDDVATLLQQLTATPEIQSGRCEVVVVDNASETPMPADFPTESHLRLIQRPDNGGFAVGVNAGWRASRSPWLLLLNPDVEASSDFLSRVLERIDHHETRADGPPGIVGFALKNPDGSPQPSVGSEPSLWRSLIGQLRPRSARKYQPGSPRPGVVPWVTGACLLIQSALMEQLGGMDEDFFLYYEEVALCRSVRALGHRVEFDNGASVVHLHPLQNREIASKMRVIVRHAKLLFFRKHQPRWQFRLLCEILKIESKVRRWRANRRGNRAEAGAWREVGRIAQDMAKGRDIRGRTVSLRAEAAVQGISPAPHSPRPHKRSTARSPR